MQPCQRRKKKKKERENRSEAEKLVQRENEETRVQEVPGLLVRGSERRSARANVISSSDGPAVPDPRECSRKACRRGGAEPKEDRATSRARIFCLRRANISTGIPPSYSGSLL